MALVKDFWFLAMFLNLFQPGKLNRLRFLAYDAEVTGSSEAMIDRGSSVISPVSHSMITL